MANEIPGFPRTSTHWEGCYRVHAECAAVHVDNLEAELAIRADRLERTTKLLRMAEARLRYLTGALGDWQHENEEGNGDIREAETILRHAQLEAHAFLGELEGD